MADELDEPVSLKFNHGNTLPPNFKVIAVVVGVASLGLLLSPFFYVGIVILVMIVFTLTQQHIVEIDESRNLVHDYSLHLKFIKMGKKYPLDKYLYVTAMPLVESAQVYSRSSYSTTLSNNFYAVTIFGNRFKGKRVLMKFDSKSEASEVAQKLANRLNKKFFEYDPKLVREVLLGQRTL